VVKRSPRAALELLPSLRCSPCWLGWVRARLSIAVSLIALALAPVWASPVMALDGFSPLKSRLLGG